MVASVSNTSGIDLDGVIDDEVDWAEWVDLGWVTTEALHGVTHGSQVDDGGHSTIKSKERKVKR